VSDLARVEVEERDDVVIARVEGELDLSSSPSAGEAIEAALPSSAHGLIVDFSALEFLDSSGVSMLFRLARRVTDHRQQLHVVAPDGDAVGRVLEIVKFERAAPVHATVDDALRTLRAALD
jgi:anti-sigma B factor antagonist